MKNFLFRESICPKDGYRTNESPKKTHVFYDAERYLGHIGHIFLLLV